MKEGQEEFFIRNKKLPNLSELEEIEKTKYSLINLDFLRKNDILKRIADENKIILLNKIDYLCHKNEKRCFVITPHKDKIHYNKDHSTLSGAKFFGERIYDINWLQLK